MEVEDHLEVVEAHQEDHQGVDHLEVEEVLQGEDILGDQEAVLLMEDYHIIMEAHQAVLEDQEALEALEVLEAHMDQGVLGDQEDQEDMEEAHQEEAMEEAHQAVAHQVVKEVKQDNKLTLEDHLEWTLTILKGK